MFFPQEFIQLGDINKAVVYQRFRQHKHITLSSRLQYGFKKKPSLRCKQGLFLLQTRLVYTPKKPCLKMRQKELCFSPETAARKDGAPHATNTSPIQCQIYKQHRSLLCCFRSILWFPCHYKTHLGFGNLIVFMNPTIQFPLHRLRHLCQTMSSLQRE